MSGPGALAVIATTLPRRAAPVLALLLLVLALPGCGKRGDPVPPGPEDQVRWPRTYPSR